MKRLHNRLIILSICALIFLPNTALSATEKKIALVIGNGNYLDAPLRNPVNDATDMASALEKLGFKVTLKTNANQRLMEESIRSFGKQLRTGAVGLFYYAGHGIQFRGTNYLIPIHAEIKSGADVKYEAVDASRVLTQMEDAGNNLNIIILDACRNNPFARVFRSKDQGLAKMDAPTGSILAYATAPGSVAADGAGRNGLYTERLLKHMKTPGITVERMFKLVRRDVTKGSQKEQVPWEASSLIGDFYFVESRGISVVATKPESDKHESVPKLSPEPFTAGLTPGVVEEFNKIASIQSKAKKPASNIDGTYEKFPTGIVFDSSTGLEWYVGKRKLVSWKEAKSWVKGLQVGGGGWRMPTIEELRTLYADGVGYRNMTPLIETSTYWIWSDKKEFFSQRAYFFSFILGKEVLASKHMDGTGEPLAVRTRK